MDSKTIEWLKLSLVFSAGNHHLWDAAALADNDPGNALKLIESGMFHLTTGETNMYKKLNELIPSVIQKCQSTDTEIICFDDPDYPERLKSIFSPPAVIYFKGCRECLKSILSISVVGTRKSSAYGEKAAYRISNELAAAGFTIISGFALGTDTNAHRGALDADGRTIAVLGCGLDIDYPRSNTDLREKIVIKGGLISEFPPGTPPLGKNFPVRNRIISGLSLGVFTAEAPLKSGALITADLAIEQGRDVFMLPPADIFDDRYKGVVRYLRDGAFPVFGSEDIISEYISLYPGLSAYLESMEVGVNEDKIIQTETVEKKKHDTKAAAVLPPLEGIKSEIAALLSKGCMHIDELSEALETSTDNLMFELTELEMDGVVISLPGKMYKLH